MNRFHPHIVAIGGGTGLSTMLRGLKNYTENLTAVVTMADDGGGSGKLRKEMGILPPGDLRNCLVALATAEPAMEALFSYRFESGSLKGQSAGNLIIAAMDGISGSFEEAIRRVGEVLSIKGRVLPVTTEDIYMYARFSDGSRVLGESRIPNVKIARNCRIESVHLVPERVRPTAEVLERIEDADAILLGPGSLYTSIIPNLLVEGVADAIRKSPAAKIYVANVMGQPGETEGYTVFDHIEAIQKHAGEGLISHCVVNTGKIDESVLKRYAEDGVGPVFVDRERIERAGITLLSDNLTNREGNLARHDSERLAECIMEFLRHRYHAECQTKGLRIPS